MFLSTWMVCLISCLSSWGMSERCAISRMRVNGVLAVNSALNEGSLRTKRCSQSLFEEVRAAGSTLSEAAERSQQSEVLFYSSKAHAKASSSLGVGLARKQSGLLGRVPLFQQALQHAEHVPRQLSVLIWTVVPTPFHALYGTCAYELQQKAQSLLQAYCLMRLAATIRDVPPKLSMLKWAIVPATFSALCGSCVRGTAQTLGIKHGRRQINSLTGDSRLYQHVSRMLVERTVSSTYRVARCGVEQYLEVDVAVGKSV